jgi:hypothetical protein
LNLETALILALTKILPQIEMLAQQKSSSVSLTSQNPLIMDKILNALGSRARSAREADNLTDICEAIV